MPRTTIVESVGCPPLRALTFDVLGLIKVTEARSKQGGVPKVVERWGEIDSSRCVLTVSTDDRKTHPLLAVSRKSGVIELLSSINGDLRVSLPSDNQSDVRSQEDNIVGLHLFKKHTSESSSRLLLDSQKSKTAPEVARVPSSADILRRQKRSGGGL